MTVKYKTMEQFKGFQNMIIITQEEYARLKKIEEVHLAKNKCVFKTGYGMSTVVITNDEAINKLKDEHENLFARYETCIHENNMILKLRNMSVWQFIKWRKS